jgi:hypothetical protein
MTGRHQDASSLLNRLTGRHEDFVPRAGGHPQAEVDNPAPLGRCPQQSPGHQGGVGIQGLTEDPHGEELHIGQTLAEDSRYGRAMTDEVAKILIFLNLSFVIQEDAHSADRPSDMGMPRIHSGVYDADAKGFGG